jgi:transposase
MAYSMEFRIEVAAAYDKCGSSIEVAEEKKCSESWVRRLIQRRTETGSLAPKTPDRSGTRRLDDDDVAELRRLIEAKPDMTLGELAEALKHKASVPTIWRTVEAQDLTLKKNHPRRRARPAGRQRKTRPLVCAVRGREAESACFSRRIWSDDEHGSHTRPRPARQACRL